MAHHTRHMREATHANTTTFFFVFFFFKYLVFYKVTSHHLSLNTEAGLTDRKAGGRAGGRIGKCQRFKVDILLREKDLRVHPVGFVMKHYGLYLITPLAIRGSGVPC